MPNTLPSLGTHGATRAFSSNQALPLAAHPRLSAEPFGLQPAALCQGAKRWLSHLELRRVTSTFLPHSVPLHCSTGPPQPSGPRLEGGACSTGHTSLGHQGECVLAADGGHCTQQLLLSFFKVKTQIWFNPAPKILPYKSFLSSWVILRGTSSCKPRWVSRPQKPAWHGGRCALCPDHTAPAASWSCEDRYPPHFPLLYCRLLPNKRQF